MQCGAGTEQLNWASYGNRRFCKAQGRVGRVPRAGGASTGHAKLGCTAARGTVGGSKQWGTRLHGASGDGDHHVWEYAPAPSTVPAMSPPPAQI